MILRFGLLLLATLFCAASSLTCVKAPTLPAWKLAILVDEFGHWVSLAPLAVGMAAILASRLGRWWRIGVAAVCAVAFALLWKPAMQARRLASALPAELEKAYGPAAVSRPVFSFSRLFFPPRDDSPVREEMRVFSPARGSSEPELSLDFYYAVRAAGSAPAPAVIVIHGGGWDSGDRKQFAEFNRYLARRGFAVAAIDYRLAPTFIWPAQAEDTRAAIAYLEAHAKELGLDPRRIVLFGRSAGGQIAEAVAYDHPPQSVRGVASWYAPADLYFAWRYTREDDLLNSFFLMRQYTGGTPETADANFASASAYLHAGRGSVPTLLAHGQLDALVWHRQSQRLAARLHENNVPCVFLDLPWATHAFDYNPDGPGGQLSAFALEWFLRAVTGAGS